MDGIFIKIILKKLHPTFNDFNKSGICHHIIYNKHIIYEIFNLIEKHHNQTFGKFI